MARLNEVCIPAGKMIDNAVDLNSIEAALAITSVKYNTTLKADEDSLYFAPEVMADAVAMVGCTITQECDMPTVLQAKQYLFMAGCNLCLNELKSNEKKAFGMNYTRPEPTSKLSDRYENKFIQNNLVSTRKINWLGNTAYTAANLVNAALLPNYKKVDGIWTDLIGLTVPAPVAPIAKNTAATKALQTAWTETEVLDLIDEMFDKQTLTMSTIVDSEKIVWITVEMYDALIRAMTRKSFDLCCVGTLASQITGGVEVPTIMYGDKTIVKYDEFSAAIKDLAPSVAGTWLLPNRAVLALGLPIVNYVDQGSFEEDFDKVTGQYKASYGLATAIVEPLPSDFYVLAY